MPCFLRTVWTTPSSLLLLSPASGALSSASFTSSLRANIAPRRAQIALSSASTSNFAFASIRFASLSSSAAILLLLFRTRVQVNSVVRRAENLALHGLPALMFAGEVELNTVLCKESAKRPHP
jgi:hypothetical protein